VKRAERFVFQRDRDSFIIARGVLRRILAYYLGTEPTLLRFSYNDYGKPRVLTAEPVQFNLSHSHNLATIAIALNRSVGIDIERIRPIADAEQLAEHFFSREEIRVFRALPAHLKQAAFFRCWTRKEAYIKARGMGLSFPLDAFTVPLTSGGPVRPAYTQQDLEAASDWSLRGLCPGAGYVGALVVEGKDLQVKRWQWSG
jgi:4'-phosphopantetheinyl transferase